MDDHDDDDDVDDARQWSPKIPQNRPQTTDSLINDTRKYRNTYATYNRIYI